MQINGKEYTITQLQGSLWHWPERHESITHQIFIFSRVENYKWAFLSLEKGSNRLQNAEEEQNTLDVIANWGLQFIGFIDELDPTSLLYEKGILT